MDWLSILIPLALYIGGVLHHWRATVDPSPLARYHRAQ